MEEEYRLKELEFRMKLLEELFGISSEIRLIRQEIESLKESSSSGLDDVEEKLNTLLTKYEDNLRALISVESKKVDAEENVALKTLALEDKKSQRGNNLAVGSAIFSALAVGADKLPQLLELIKPFLE